MRTRTRDPTLRGVGEARRESELNWGLHSADVLGMSKSGHSRRIEVRVPSRVLSAGTRTALERLGYQLVPASPRGAAPDARIVAAGRLSRLRAEASEPVILVGGSRSREVDDPRVVGVVQRPIGILELYQLLQVALEAHPREVPRAPVSLAARTLRDGVDAPGAILSLSEKGCLLRSPARLSGVGTLRLQFMLPNEGLIYTRADLRHEAGEESGLAFDGLPETSRAAIADFVMATLTVGPEAVGAHPCQ